jgi:hypothetical protein
MLNLCTSDGFLVGALFSGRILVYGDRLMPQDVPKSDPSPASAPRSNLFGSDRKGWYFIYGFFLIHMLAFGSVGFYMAYGDNSDPGFNYMFSGFAILIYLVFYLVIFGLDEIRWLFINSGLGILGILAQLDWMLGLFGASTADYATQAHIIPVIYYIMYTFLLRRSVMHIFHADAGTRRKRIIEWIYVAGSLLIYVPILLF